MSSGVSRDGPTKSQRSYLRQNATLLADLPEPGDHWRSNKIPDELVDKLDALREKGVIRRIDRVEAEEWAKLRCLWETDPDAYEYVQNILKNGDREGLLPCGHSAISNERGVDGITCGVCGKIHDRDEVDR